MRVRGAPAGLEVPASARDAKDPILFGIGVIGRGFRWKGQSNGVSPVSLKGGLSVDRRPRYLPGVGANRWGIRKY